MKTWRRSEQISGFLDQGTSVTGELQFSNTLRIDGAFHGSIAGGEMLIVGEHAVLHADIKVGAIEIHGQVFGNVEVQRRAEISSTGRLHGDMQSPVLVMQAGALHEGRTSMTNSRTSVQESTHVVGANEERRFSDRPLP